MADGSGHDKRALTMALQAKKGEIGNRCLPTLKLAADTKDLIIKMEIVLKNFESKLDSKLAENKQTLLESFRKLNLESDRQGPCKNASAPEQSAEGLQDVMAKSEIETARQVALTFNQLDFEIKKVYMCEVCGAMFDTTWDYFNHVYFAHGQPEGQNQRYWKLIDLIFKK